MTPISEAFKALPQLVETALLSTAGTEAEEVVGSDGTGNIELPALSEKSAVSPNARASMTVFNIVKPSGCRRIQTVAARTAIA
jgi:hypothetical protein